MLNVFLLKHFVRKEDVQISTLSCDYFNYTMTLTGLGCTSNHMYHKADLTDIKLVYIWRRGNS